MANVQAFHGVPNATVNIDVSGSSQSKALGVSGNGYRQVEMTNDGTATVWYAFGDSTITTTTTAGQPLSAGGCKVQTIPNGATHVAVIAAGTTGKVYFTPGSGL